MSFRRPYRENEVFSPTPNQFDAIMQPHNPMLGGVAFETNTMGGVAFETNTLGAGFTDALMMFQLTNFLFPK
jgi:hypothetical protein